MTSTTAATRSRSTRVTMPANRLRADWPTIGPIGRRAPALGQQARTSDIGDQALAALGALDAEPAVGLPAAEGVDGDLEHLGGLADAQADVDGRWIVVHGWEVSVPPRDV